MNRGLSVSNDPSGRLYLGGVRMTEFWERMREQFGAGYADAVARDQVLAKLGGRSATQALEQGEDPRRVWLALCEHYEIPIRARH